MAEQLCLIARSRELGQAAQATWGRVTPRGGPLVQGLTDGVPVAGSSTSASQSPEEGKGLLYALLMHFPAAAQRDAFLQCPPVQALLQAAAAAAGSALPALAPLCVSFAISPAEDSRTTAYGEEPAAGPWWNAGE
jgi:hypothetical protein